MVTLRQHRLDVRESFRPSLGRCEGMWLRRRRRALPLLQRIQRRQPAAASGGLSTRRESGRRLNASARRAWEKRPLPRLTRRTPVSGGDRDAWRGSIPWLARHRAVRARQARRHEVDQGVRLSRRTRHGDAGMDTREKLPALAPGNAAALPDVRLATCGRSSPCREKRRRCAAQDRGRSEKRYALGNRRAADPLNPHVCRRVEAFAPEPT